MRNFRTQPIADNELDSYFCCHCDSRRANVADIFSHLKAAHDDRGPQRFTDFVSGLDVRERLAAEDAQADRFDRSIESLRGLDDFLLECGGA